MNLKSVMINNMLRKGAKRLSLLGVLCLTMGFSSCDSIYDDDPNCLHGIALRFVYDYHMERGANAFPANVDCINVFVFDKNGNCVTQFKETSDALRSESYRMEIPLDNGKYTIIAYGGMACEHSNFNLTPDWRSPEFLGVNKDNLEVTLPLADGVSKKMLHNIEERTGGLFFAQPLEVELTDDDYNTTYREETVYMMNDVNDIQVTLQELHDPYVVDYHDYDFKIIDDNFKLDSKNNPIYTATADYQPYYKPYALSNPTIGQVKNAESSSTQPIEEDETKLVQVARAGFSTSRLFHNKDYSHITSARLVVTSNKEKGIDGNPRTIIDIPLIEYLLLIWSEGDSWIKTPQEYLDRQSRWRLMFFLQDGKWVEANVSVDNWIVRINNAELGL